MTHFRRCTSKDNIKDASTFYSLCRKELKINSINMDDFNTGFEDHTFLLISSQIFTFYFNAKHESTEYANKNVILAIFVNLCIFRRGRCTNKTCYLKLRFLSNDSSSQM